VIVEAESPGIARRGGVKSEISTVGVKNGWNGRKALYVRNSPENGRKAPRNLEYGGPMVTITKNIGVHGIQNQTPYYMRRTKC